jgi:hypothetical protein
VPKWRAQRIRIKKRRDMSAGSDRAAVSEYPNFQDMILALRQNPLLWQEHPAHLQRKYLS